MTKKEFLDGLRAALTGKVHYSVVNENVEYYDSYIAVQVRKGEREENVLEGLGDPRLLAKTILAAGGQQTDEANGENAYQNAEEESGSLLVRLRRRAAGLPGWLLLLAILAAAVLCVTVVPVLFTLLAPVVLPILLIWWLVRFWKRMQ